MSRESENVDFSSLVGKTLVSITRSEDDEELTWVDTEGNTYKMYHSQDCCESVYLEDVVGSFEDLLGTPILKAKESTSDVDVTPSYDGEVCMWTFYRISTIKGSVVLRWYGASNGYYAIGVTFEKEVSFKQ